MYFSTELSLIVIVKLSSFVINSRFLSFKSAGAYWIDHIWYFVVSYLITNESFYTMMMMLQEKWIPYWAKLSLLLGYYTRTTYIENQMISIPNPINFMLLCSKNQFV